MLKVRGRSGFKACDVAQQLSGNFAKTITESSVGKLSTKKALEHIPDAERALKSAREFMARLVGHPRLPLDWCRYDVCLSSSQRASFPLGHVLNHVSGASGCPSWTCPVRMPASS